REPRDRDLLHRRARGRARRHCRCPDRPPSARPLLRAQPGPLPAADARSRRRKASDAGGFAAGEPGRNARACRSARERARGAKGAARGSAAGERRGSGGHRRSAGRGFAAPEHRTGPPMKFDRRLLTHFEWLLPLLVLARHFSRTPGARLGLRELFFPLMLTAVPAVAILAQPDLGTVAVLGVVSLTMLVLGGVQLRWIAAISAPVGVLAPLIWKHLKAYQQRRVLTFLNPDMDPLGAGYHVIQSKIA